MSCVSGIETAICIIIHYLDNHFKLNETGSPAVGVWPTAGLPDNESHSFEMIWNGCIILHRVLALFLSGAARSWVIFPFGAAVKNLPVAVRDLRTLLLARREFCGKRETTGGERDDQQ
jgi:hypothetical protein